MIWLHSMYRAILRSVTYFFCVNSNRVLNTITPAGGLSSKLSTGRVDWVALNELKLSCYIGETIFNTSYIYISIMVT